MKFKKTQNKFSYHLRSVVKCMKENRFLTIIKKAGQYLKRHKTFFVVTAAILIYIMLPPLVNLVISTEAFIFPDFFGYVTPETKDSWLNFFGAIIGGGITLIGVAWTIIDQNNKRREDAKDAVRPILVSGDVISEEIKGIKNDASGNKIYECILTYKNVGKGILYNPNLYKFVCTIDDIPVTTVHEPIPVLSYVDVDQSVDNDIMIKFDVETLKRFHQRLKGRGNTLQLKIIMYVGGDDMYGRTTITKLIYQKSIIWSSPIDIDKELFTGKLTSTVLFDKKEISNLVVCQDFKYKLH